MARARLARVARVVRVAWVAGVGRAPLLAAFVVAVFIGGNLGVVMMVVVVWWL